MSNRPSFVHRRRELTLGVALLGCSLAAAPMARGAIVNIDVSTFNAVNAGMTYNQSPRVISNFVPGGTLKIYFDQDYVGLGPAGGGGTAFRFADNGVDASPENFGANADISAWGGGTIGWTGSVNRTVFYYASYGDLSPNFGPGSFMGFRFGSPSAWNYGWIEVTWNWTGNPQTSTFQILGAAYESQVNTAILAGATGGGGGVPLPGAAGLAACGLLGLSRRRRR
jgi:hypothetical protein